MSGRFLWVELQIVEIVETCMDDGTVDGVPEILENLPTKLQDIYSAALQRVLNRGTAKSELARKVFQWVMYARQPMSLDELEEAVSLSINQKSWKEPSIKLRLPTLSKFCGNLLSCDESDGEIYLAHHSVLQFLQSCSDIPLINSFYFHPSEAHRHLGKLCVTYLMFNDFENAVATTKDTSEYRSVNQPARLSAMAMAGNNSRILRSAVRLRKSLKISGKKRGGDGEFDAEHTIRSMMASSNTQKGSFFKLLNYCISNWHQHCTHFTSTDIETFAAFSKLVFRKNSPHHCQPWGQSHMPGPFPHWGIFNWAVRHGHKPILQVWRENVSESIAVDSWNLLCPDCGEKLFTAACAAADVLQLHILVEIFIEAVTVDYASVQFASFALYHASVSGYLEIVDRIIGTKHNFKLAPSKYQQSNVLIAAAAGGHLAVVERLIQERADVNARPANDQGRTALQAAAEGPSCGGRTTDPGECRCRCWPSTLSLRI
jgi:hypothetical protein